MIPESILKALEKLIADISAYLSKRPPAPPIQPPVPPQPPAPPIPPAPQETPSERLYGAAYRFLGRDASPRDAANDEFGCVDSLQEVIRAAGRPYICERTLSTATLVEALLKSPTYKRITKPELGAVAVFPTNGTVVGHCGIVGRAYVMSNDSRDGIWRANYTLVAWEVAAKKRGLISYYFRPL